MAESSTAAPAKETAGAARGRRPRLPAWWPWGGGLVLVLGCLGLQSQLYSGQERTVTTVFMFVALAAAWNLIGGYTGYACFGQVGFFGLGAYTAVVLMAHARLSFWIALPAAAVVAALFAALIGLPLLRLKGHYFAVATLGVAEGLRELVTNVPRWTGGGSGATIPSTGGRAVTPWLGNDGFYLLFLGIAVVSAVVVALIARSRTGYALRAVNQDEDAAAAMGVNTTVAKTAAFAVSAALTGAAGAAYAFQQVTIYPQRLFDVDITVLMIVMVVLGGAGTVLGPILGAAGIAIASEYLRQHLPEAHDLTLGALIIIAVVLLPQGVVNFARDAVRTRDFSLLSNVRRYRL
ncbi:branched-chain amino acid ABC transporter permease [Actinomadura nitritigenes]|uniref:Branched-chain amino acid ABC transporter permease n=1 Tax=Actinomadura nitritigenes TaxID=134602 RepID=A0ABS3RF16_9ACTN|nr:branched-chain amino acid ABC transporter permease [Actinomadura nitritigenes]MBO2444751.1 branched-chain amino acid ABC transporter permease [Actinomadura nitritigenes]